MKNQEIHETTARIDSCRRHGRPPVSHRASTPAPTRRTSVRKSVRFRFISVGSAAMAVLLVAACSSGSGGGAAKNDSLNVVQAAAPLSLNPNIDSIRASLRISNQIVEQAAAYRYADGKTTLTPLLVTGWKQTAPTEWTYNVRPHVSFTNGEKLTADTFKFSLEAGRDKDGQSLSFLFKTWSIDIVDPMTFKVITERPNDSTVPGLMNSFFLVPPKYFASTGAVKYGEKPIGTGPYVLGKFVKGSEVDLVANGKYWGKKATIEKVAIRAVADDGTRVSQVLAGQAQVDVSVAQPLLSRVTQSNDYEIRSVQTYTNFFLMFNSHIAPFNDVRVRQAVNYAIDRQTLVKNLFQETAVPATQWYSPLFDGFDKSYNPYPYNPDKAKQLLAEAGHPNGVDVDFYFPIGAYPLDQQAAEVIQSQLQQIGLRVHMMGGVLATVGAKFRAGDAPGFFLNNAVPPTDNPGTLFNYYLTPGATYSMTATSPEAVKLAQQAGGTVDPQARATLFNKAQDVFLGSQSLFVPMWTVIDNWAVAKNVALTPAPLQNLVLNDVSYK